jgi:hypothetical protein
MAIGIVVLTKDAAAPVNGASLKRGNVVKTV